MRSRPPTAGDKDVGVMGGANVIEQSLAAGLVDELCIHLSPLVLGGGTRLFDLVGPMTLVQREVTESPRATHLTYEVVRDQWVGDPDQVVGRLYLQWIPRSALDEVTRESAWVYAEALGVAFVNEAMA